MNIFVYKDEQTYGPLDSEGLGDYLEQGYFTPEDSACEVGSEEWKCIGDFLSASAPAPTPNATTREVRGIQIDDFDDDDDHLLPYPTPWKAALYAAISVVVCALCIAGVAYSLRPDDSYKHIEPLNRVIKSLNHDARVIRQLGINIRPDSDYEEVFKNQSSNLDTAFIVVGSESTGTVSLRAKRDGPDWIFRKLVLEATIPSTSLRATVNLLNPSADEREYLLAITLKSFEAAIKNKHFEAFHSTLHPDFQDEYSPSELSDIFNSFNSFDFKILENVIPVFSSIENQIQDNLSLMNGFYELPKSRLYFTVSFANYPKRKLRGLSFELKAKEDQP